MQVILLRVYLTIMGTVIMACLFGYVTHGDYLEEVDTGNYYCEMVRAGSWPNYKDWDCHVDEDK
jgi:hypothetical protein